MQRACYLLLIAAAASVGGAPVCAGVIEFTDQAEWEASVGRFTTIDFTGFPEGTVITDQYADLGVLFLDGNDTILFSTGFPNDGAGLRGGFFDDIELSFDTPQLWIAVNFPGIVQFELFHQGELIYISTIFDVFPGDFAGLLSTQPFDAVAISDPSDDFVFIDDLHFGVPAPPTVALLGLATLLVGRQPRRRG